MTANNMRAIVNSSKDFTKAHKTSITFKDFPKTPGLLILTCVDPRADPRDVLTFPEGVAPGILRIAGGRVKQAIPTILGLSTVLGYGTSTVGTVAIIHHTDCGLLNFSNEFIAGKLKERVKDDAGLVAKVDSLEFGAFDDAEQSVKDDIAILKSDPFMPKDLEVIGFVHVFEGTLTEVS